MNTVKGFFVAASLAVVVLAGAVSMTVSNMENTQQEYVQGVGFVVVDGE